MLCLLFSILVMPKGRKLCVWMCFESSDSRRRLHQKGAFYNLIRHRKGWIQPHFCLGPGLWGQDFLPGHGLAPASASQLVVAA